MPTDKTAAGKFGFLSTHKILLSHESDLKISYRDVVRPIMGRQTTKPLLYTAFADFEKIYIFANQWVTSL